MGLKPNNPLTGLGPSDLIFLVGRVGVITIFIYLSQLLRHETDGCKILGLNTNKRERVQEESQTEGKFTLLGDCSS